MSTGAAGCPTVAIRAMNMGKPVFKPGPVLTRNGLVLGNISVCAGGFIFIPATAAHKSSRKIHPTPEASLPRWVRAELA